MKKKIFLIILCGVMLLGLSGCKKDDAEKDLQETIDKYGVVEKETVDTVLAKFNTEIMDGGVNTPAVDDYMVVDGGSYWFALTDEVSIYLKPVQMSEDKTKDILDMSALYFEKETYDEKEALKYTKMLIKANNDKITDDEIDKLLDDAKEKTSNNGKGISVSIVDAADHIEYQVVRLFV